jgi:hypothetical protein
VNLSGLALPDQQLGDLGKLLGDHARNDATQEERRPSNACPSILCR